jgi:hypothetical protein
VLLVEDNHLQGFPETTGIRDELGMRCDTKGTLYTPGWYVFIDACTWKWIAPLPIHLFRVGGMFYSPTMTYKLSVTG